MERKRLGGKGEDVKKMMCDIGEIWDKGLEGEEYVRDRRREEEERMKGVA